MIFRAISARTAVSRTQLAEQTGLSNQSVGRVVRDLLDAGLIEETEIDRAGGPGAPPVGLHIRADGAYALGFGLERDYLSGVVLDLEHTVRWQSSRRIAKSETAAATLHRLEEDVRELLARPEWSDKHSRLYGLGLAAPGPIDIATGTILGPPNFPGWQHVDVVEELSRAALHVPVLIDNAATAAAIGIAWRLPHDHGPYLYCYWGLGIGGGLLHGDNVYRGMTGNAIEIGHVVVQPSGRPCACGGTGCLETEASAIALMRDVAIYGNFRNLREVVAASRNRPEIAALLRNAAEKLAVALVSVINIVDVDQVIMGGEHFREVEEVFLPVILDRIEHSVFRRRTAKTTVTVSDAGEVVNAIGAAALIFHSLLPRDALRRNAAEQTNTPRGTPGRGLWDRLESRP